MITEPMSINWSAPSVSKLPRGATSLPRDPLPSHQGQGPWPFSLQMELRLIGRRGTDLKCLVPRHF